MGGVIVENQSNFGFGRVVGVDLTKELDEFESESLGHKAVHVSAINSARSDTVPWRNVVLEC